MAVELRGTKPGEHVYGTAADFFTARRESEIVWREFSSKKTEADYQAWRDYRDLIARKYASWARGERPPASELNDALRLRRPV
jgi:hypothetical protein